MSTVSTQPITRRIVRFDEKQSPKQTKAQSVRKSEDARRASGQRRFTTWIDGASYDAGYYAALAGKPMELPKKHVAAYAFGYERGQQVEVADDDEGDSQ